MAKTYDTVKADNLSQNRTYLQKYSNTTKDITNCQKTCEGSNDCGIFVYNGTVCSYTTKSTIIAQRGPPPRTFAPHLVKVGRVAIRAHSLQEKSTAYNRVSKGHSFFYG